jgi:hypothetical protein
MLEAPLPYLRCHEEAWNRDQVTTIIGRDDFHVADPGEPEAIEEQIV